MIPRRFFWVFDLVVLVAAFLVTYSLIPHVLPLYAPGGPLRTAWVEELFSPNVWENEFPPLANFLWVFLIMTPTSLLALGMLGGHGPLLYQSRTRIWISSLGAPLVGLGLVTLVLFALKNVLWSRSFIFSFIALGALGLGLYRTILRWYFGRRRAAGFYAKNVLLVALPESLKWVAAYFAESVPTTDYCLVGYLRLCSAQSAPQPARNGKNGLTRVEIDPLGDVDELGDLLIRQPIHEVIAVIPSSGGEWIKKVIEACDYFGVLLRIVPEALVFGQPKTLKTLYPLEPLHLPAVVLAPPHWDSESLFFKRLFDIAVSTTLLVLCIPLFAIVALAIKITTPDLPVLYRWRVVGRNGVEFTGYKFTTMFANADDRKSDLASQNEMTGPVFKIKDDPRATPLGRFLRKFSINELPQLWSVLIGDMSLVGPRPAFRHELERYEFWHKRKLSIRPGITCLWQVRGRNQISNFDDWVKMDLEYIDNWSLWLDFKILVWTARAVIAGTGS